jgi:hypothetical protein
MTERLTAEQKARHLEERRLRGRPQGTHLPRTEEEKAARRQGLREWSGLEPGTGEAALPLPARAVEPEHRVTRGVGVVSEIEDRALATARRDVIAGALPEMLRCPMNGNRVGRPTCLECVRVDGRCDATRRYLEGQAACSIVAGGTRQGNSERGPETIVAMAQDETRGIGAALACEDGPGPEDMAATDESGPPPINPKTGRRYSSWAKYRQGQRVSGAWAKKRAAKSGPSVQVHVDLAGLVGRVVERLQADGKPLGGDGVKAEPLPASPVPDLPYVLKTSTAPTAHFAIDGTWYGPELEDALMGLSRAVGAETVGGRAPSRWRVRVEIEREASS